MRWRRWLKYGKAKLDQTVRDADAELDRKEAQLAAERAGKPWLTPSSDTPTLDEVKARMEDRATTGRAPQQTPADADAEAANLELEMDMQRKAAERRLAEIRKSLDLPARDDDTH